MESPKILIVDDDPDLRQALRLRLRANRFTTVSATDGYSAIAQAYKGRPNLIILDLGLPAGNGFAVLNRLREDDKLSTIPVVVLTAREPHGNEERALRPVLWPSFKSLPTMPSCWKSSSPRWRSPKVHL